MTSISFNQVLVLVDASTNPQGEFELPPDFMVAVNTLKEAIATPLSSDGRSPKVILVSTHQPLPPTEESDLIIPLTLNLPESLEFAGRSLYDACRQAESLRERVQSSLKVATGEGHYWLPVVLTAKGPLYAEVIGQDEQGQYIQPIHLGDRWRQPLYRFANQLLAHLQATPAVYLVQFGFNQDMLVFDRLVPFPALPAIASIGVQTPDLLRCHWQCLTHQSILDVAIAAPVPHVIYDPAIA